ncbi:MAG TPA: DUF4388 domain-containing protein [Acidimicrobiales bacterium]|jgi:hypothetical protein|nr:DUF4388 domain-containing protein [Acidimicrobiales bacterium]
MPLAGTFDVLDFGEVLGLLSRRSATGRLQVRAMTMHGTIWLADGRATAAEISGSSAGETRHKWRNQIEDICFDALRSARGSFEFHSEDASAVPAGPRVRLETVLASGRRRLEMWQEVESVIHSFEAVPKLAEALGDDGLTLDKDRWRVLVAIDARRTVAALAKRLDIELLEFCQLLKPMIESGAVTLDQPEGWLKSLPKVRLDPGPNTESGVIDPGSPDDAMNLVESKPVDHRAEAGNPEAAPTAPAQLVPKAAIKPVPVRPVEAAESRRRRIRPRRSAGPTGAENPGT